MNPTIGIGPPGVAIPPKYKNFNFNKCFAHAPATAVATRVAATGVAGGTSKILPLFHALLKSFASDVLLPYDIGAYTPSNGGVILHGGIGGPLVNG